MLLCTFVLANRAVSLHGTYLGQILSNTLWFWNFLYWPICWKTSSNSIFSDLFHKYINAENAELFTRNSILRCVQENYFLRSFHVRGFPVQFLLKPAPLSLYVVWVQIVQSIVIPQMPTHSQCYRMGTTIQSSKNQMKMYKISWIVCLFLFLICSYFKKVPGITFFPSRPFSVTSTFSLRTSSMTNYYPWGHTW